MLQITIGGVELFDDRTNEFINIKETTLQLEHSLISISKWEANWKKSFLSTKDKTAEELRDYVKCMTLTQNVDPNVYLNLSKKNIDDVNAYINDPMTATTFTEVKGNGSGGHKKITSEEIYYQMTALNIPWECQKWHINRLMTLIKICSIKNSKPKKMSKSEIMSRNAELNAQRRQQMNSRG